MKTSRLSFLLILALLGARAFALNQFECLRDLMPISELGAFQMARVGVERPFSLEGGYLVFPEVAGKSVTGFFLYDAEGAWYYDSVEGSRPIMIGDLPKGFVVYHLVAKPKGLGTVIIPFMPGYDPRETNREGPVALGSSVLPIVGAMVSRPNRPRDIYTNPEHATPGQLETWAERHAAPMRAPASTRPLAIEKQIHHLRTAREKLPDALWRPLREELAFRKKWISTHNLDDQAYRKFSAALGGSCKD